MNQQEMTDKIVTGLGFIAALDQSGGSTPKALRGYGVADAEWSGDDEMFAKIHEMRCRVITAPSFANGKVIGAILFERTMDGSVSGTPAPDALKDRGIVPFIKVDEGLMEEADGVQLMKPMAKLDALLEKSVTKGMFGTKMRSVIHAANTDGIKAVVGQQFEVGSRIADAGLMPILEPEYTITSADRADGEKILRDEILAQLDALPAGRKVMLKLSIPVEANLYKPLVNHPNVLRVVALSGGFTREDACEELAANTGMIASFSRALLEELRAQMSDDQFDNALGEAINHIQRASIAG